MGRERRIHYYGGTQYFLEFLAKKYVLTYCNRNCWVSSGWGTRVVKDITCKRCLKKLAKELGMDENTPAFVMHDIQIETKNEKTSL